MTKVVCRICGCLLGDAGNSTDQHWLYTHQYDCDDIERYRRDFVVELKK